MSHFCFADVVQDVDGRFAGSGAMLLPPLRARSPARPVRLRQWRRETRLSAARGRLATVATCGTRSVSAGGGAPAERHRDRAGHRHGAAVPCVPRRAAGGGRGQQSSDRLCAHDNPPRLKASSNDSNLTALQPLTQTALLFRLNLAFLHRNWKVFSSDRNRMLKSKSRCVFLFIKIKIGIF